MATWGPTLAAEDARQAHNTNGFMTDENPMKCNSSTVSAQRHSALFRFTDVGIPQGSTIDSATFRVYVDNATLDNANLDIHCEDIGNSVALDTYATVVNRAVTENSTEWVEDGCAVAQHSKDITSAVEEVISRSDWSSDNALSVIMVARDDQVKYLSISAEEETGEEPELEIDYTAPATARVVRSAKIRITPQ